MRRRTLAGLVVTMGLLAVSPGLAQNGPGGAPPMAGGVVPAGPPTLAEALGQAEQPRQDVYLTVGAERVRLPKASPDDPEGGGVPPPGSNVGVVAAAYGRTVFTFGGVTALAPPTMTLLNTSPGAPNAFADMPKGDAFRLLAGSLSGAQWAALTSSRGLGAGDLTDETQRGLFAVLVPPKEVTLHPMPRDWGRDGGGTGGTITVSAADMAQARLRLGQRVMIGLPMAGKNAWLNSPDQGMPGQTQYQMYGTGAQGKDTLYGVKVRDTVPNAPKDGGLNFETPALKAAVSLDGVQTVGDLMARVGRTVGVELYADRRYEKRRVTVLGPKGARARDVLQAVALCVAGTYRPVGPAFVLTDDVMGLGTRRMLLHRFAQTADMLRHGVVAEAGDRLATAHGGVDDLPTTATTDLGFSDAQKQTAAKGESFQMPGQGMSLQIPLAQLTPQQQQLARHLTDSWNESRAASPGGDQDTLTLDGKLLLQTQASIQMLTSAAPGPVDMSNEVNVWNLFQPSPKMQQEFWRKQQEQRAAAAASRAPGQPVPAAKPPPPPPVLSAVLAGVTRRAVIAHPKTAQDVDALVASMKAVGLNQLWLDVFSGGKSRLTPPDAKSGEDGKAGGPDILAEALAQTKGTGITVVPLLDLLDWDKDAPAEAVDRTMLGETSGEAGAIRQHYDAVVYQGQSEDDASRQAAAAAAKRSVSPASETVRQTLTALVGRLAATPGVTALAVQGTVTTGYDILPDSRYGVSGDSLGYVVPLRLEFLRRQHVDPIDLEPESYEGEMNADTSLPEFDDYAAVDDARARWNALRGDADRDLMARLLAAARASGSPTLSFWVKTRRSTYQADWYGLWEDPRGPLPALSEEKAFSGTDPNADYAALARAQCRTNVFLLNFWVGQSSRQLAQAVKDMKPGWNGFVLDLSDSSGDPLAGLVKSLPAPAQSPPASPP